MREKKSTAAQQSLIRSRILLWLVLFYNTFLMAGLLLLSPLLVFYIAVTLKRRHTFLKRMGCVPYSWQQAGKFNPNRVWIHALSVGEVLAAQPLVEKLLQSNPDQDVFFTASTLTGFQTANRIFSQKSISLAYFPYDVIWSVRRIANMIDPTCVIIIETDIWPTFLWEMKQRNIPVYLVNLKISDRSWKRYIKFKWLIKSLYMAFEGIGVQTTKELECLKELGISSNRICITGNLKFDGMGYSAETKPVDHWRRIFNQSANHQTIVAGSTHEGEEVILFEALVPLLTKYSNVSLVIAPRDPFRSRAVQAKSRQFGLHSELLSHLIIGKVREQGHVVVVDVLGALKELYALADIAYVGGSMVSQGGHNPLEPAFWAKPILFGNDMRDFATIADYLLSSGAARKINTGNQLRSVVEQLLNDPERAEKMGKQALTVFLSNQGAADRTVSFIKKN